MKLFVSKIQRFSVGDGPGIRTTVFLGGCNLRCPWCHNPETQEAKPQILRFDGGRDERCGREMTVREVFDVIGRDTDFYSESGGGVTVSGGEPLLQSAAVAELFGLCRAASIPTLLDTAGCVPFDAFLPLLGTTDLWYYDVKAGDDATYRNFTGGSFSLVAENLLALTARGEDVVVRIPLVYGVNTDGKCVRSIGDLCRRAGVREIDLLPYHKLGVAKYKALGRAYPFAKQQYTPASRVEACRAAYASMGFAVKTETY